MICTICIYKKIHLFYRIIYLTAKFHAQYGFTLINNYIYSNWFKMWFTREIFFQEFVSLRYVVSFSRHQE